VQKSIIKSKTNGKRYGSALVFAHKI